jgi:hypothetical protein
MRTAASTTGAAAAYRLKDIIKHERRANAVILKIDLRTV